MSTTKSAKMVFTNGEMEREIMESMVEKAKEMELPVVAKIIGQFKGDIICSRSQFVAFKDKCKNKPKGDKGRLEYQYAMDMQSIIEATINQRNMSDASSSEEEEIHGDFGISKTNNDDNKVHILDIMTFMATQLTGSTTGMGSKMKPEITDSGLINTFRNVRFIVNGYVTSDEDEGSRVKRTESIVYDKKHLKALKKIILHYNDKIFSVVKLYADDTNPQHKQALLQADGNGYTLLRLLRRTGESHISSLALKHQALANMTKSPNENGSTYCLNVDHAMSKMFKTIESRKKNLDQEEMSAKDYIQGVTVFSILKELSNDEKYSKKVQDFMKTHTDVFESSVYSQLISMVQVTDEFAEQGFTQSSSNGNSPSSSQLSAAATTLPLLPARPSQPTQPNGQPTATMQTDDFYKEHMPDVSIRSQIGRGRGPGQPRQRKQGYGQHPPHVSLYFDYLEYVKNANPDMEFEDVREIAQHWAHDVVGIFTKKDDKKGKKNKFNKRDRTSSETSAAAKLVKSEKLNKKQRKNLNVQLKKIKRLKSQMAATASKAKGKGRKKKSTKQKSDESSDEDENSDSESEDEELVNFNTGTSSNQ